jgi:hypothetical protein
MYSRDAISFYARSQNIMGARRSWHAVHAIRALKITAAARVLHNAMRIYFSAL